MNNPTFQTKAEAIAYAKKYSCPVGLHVRVVEDCDKSYLYEVSPYAEYEDEPYYMGNTLIWPGEDD